MKTIIVLIGILIVISAKAQNPVSWSFVAKKVTDKNYEVHLTPLVQHPWHIYSQTSPEEGALPTAIRFNKNPLISVEGKVKEVGKVVTKYEEVFDVTVKYFEGKVDFVQMVKLKSNAKTSISGTIEFMTCNDEQCLPPKKVLFNIALQ